MEAFILLILKKLIYTYLIYHTVAIKKTKNNYKFEGQKNTVIYFSIFVYSNALTIIPIESIVETIELPP